jgi:hypothetical protein
VLKCFNIVLLCQTTVLICQRTLLNCLFISNIRIIMQKWAVDWAKSCLFYDKLYAILSKSSFDWLKTLIKSKNVVSFRNVVMTCLNFFLSCKTEVEIWCFLIKHRNSLVMSNNCVNLYKFSFVLKKSFLILLICPVIFSRSALALVTWY